MLIGTAIIEAGPNKFSEFLWGEDLVHTVNSLFDKHRQITLDMTGHELEEIVNKMGKQARRAIEKYPINATPTKGFQLFIKLFGTIGIKNSVVIMIAVIMGVFSIVFGTIESVLFAHGNTGASDSYILKFFDLFNALIKNLNG